MRGQQCPSYSDADWSLDVEDCSEELLRQQSYAIKNQALERKIPSFRAWKPTILMA